MQEQKTSWVTFFMRSKSLVGSMANWFNVFNDTITHISVVVNKLLKSFIVSYINLTLAHNQRNVSLLC